MAGVTSSIWTGWRTQGASAPPTNWSPTSQSTTEQTCWRVRHQISPTPTWHPPHLPAYPLVVPNAMLAVHALHAKTNTFSLEMSFHWLGGSVPLNEVLNINYCKWLFMGRNELYRFFVFVSVVTSLSLERKKEKVFLLVFICHILFV